MPIWFSPLVSSFFYRTITSPSNWRFLPNRLWVIQLIGDILRCFFCSFRERIIHNFLSSGCWLFYRWQIWQAQNWRFISFDFFCSSFPWQYRLLYSSFNLIPVTGVTISEGLVYSWLLNFMNDPEKNPSRNLASLARTEVRGKPVSSVSPDIIMDDRALEADTKRQQQNLYS